MNQESLFEDLPEVDSGKYEASMLSNQKFCYQVEQSLVAIGFREAQGVPSQNEFLKSVPYTDMYGGIRKAAFLVQHQTLGAVRIEAHKQEQSGSVDQKFPFFLESLRLAPEHNLVILLGGKGYKQKAFDWIKTAASNIQDKQIKVFSDLDEFISFFVSK